MNDAQKFLDRLKWQVEHGGGAVVKVEGENYVVSSLPLHDEIIRAEERGDAGTEKWERAKHAKKVAPWFVGLDEVLGPPRPEWKPPENPAGLVCEAAVACDRASQALELLVRYSTHKDAVGVGQ
jgi:hypothetical protein